MTATFKPRSGNASNAFRAVPFWSQNFVTLSRPVEASLPSWVNRTLAAPPGCAAQFLICPPFSISHSLIVVSSLHVASTFESSRHETSVIIAVCPRRLKYSRPVNASHTNMPPLRSPVASSTPSGLYSTVTPSRCAS